MIRGTDIDLNNWRHLKSTSGAFGAENPDVLGGSYMEHSCECLFKLVYPLLWKANGITFVNAQDLIMCNR